MRKHPLANCEECPLCDPKWKPAYSTGPANADIAFIGEAPGAEEAWQGKPFVGQSGVVLRHTLSAVGVDADGVLLTNAILCRPPNNATPPAAAVAACRPRLLAELRDIKATLVPLGSTALKALTGEDKILDVRGRWITSSLLPQAVLPTLHPAYVLRNANAHRDFEFDIAKATRGKIVTEDVEKWEPLVVAQSDWKIQYEFAPIAFDIETGADGQIFQVNIAWGPTLADVAVILPDAFSQVLPQVFNGRSTIAHNGKFDVAMLKLAGYQAYCTYDTLLAHYALDERSGGEAQKDAESDRTRALHGLKVLAAQFLDAPDYGEVMRPYKKDYSKAPVRIVAWYGGLDAHYTYRLWQLFRAELEKQGMFEHVFLETLMPLSDACVEMTLNGFLLDEPERQRLEMKWGSMLEWMYDEMLDALGPDAQKVAGKDGFNPRSPKQIQALLYDVWKLPLQRVESGKNYSKDARTADKSALEKFKDKHPFVPLLLKYRRLEKLLSSYIEALPQHVWKDGRAHPDFKIHGTITGRLSSYFHTIPRADDAEEGQLGLQIKSLFIAPPGSTLVTVDLSQAELRIAAAFSKDPVLLGLFERGEDPHGGVAKSVFGPNAGKEERYAAKAVNFGFLYGGRKSTLMRRLLEIRAGRPSLPADPAAIEAIVDRYMLTMSALVDWREQQYQTILRQGYVETPTGRRKRFTLITKDNEDEVRKAAINSPIQGTATDINSHAMIRLMKLGYKVLLQVHDSIIIEYSGADLMSAAHEIQAVVLEECYRWVPGVKWESDVEVGQRWGQTEKLKLAH